MRDSLFTAFLCLAVAGCSDADADKLRLVGDKTYDRAATLVQQTWDELGRTLLDQKPVELPEHDLLSKVQWRLKWERDLQGLSLVVSVHGNEVVIQGQVMKKEQKEKALTLAETTVGVVKVKDEIKLEDNEKKEETKTPAQD